MIPAHAEVVKNTNIAVEDKKTVIAILFFLLGICCIIYYGWCVSYAGFGISMIWIWLLGGITFCVLGGLLLYFGKQRLFDRIPFSTQCILGTGLVVLVVIFLLMELVVASGMRKKGEPDLDYVVVLGCKVNGEHPSRALKERMEQARMYLEQNPETKAILSGGQGPGEGISEAECMYRYLQETGISEKRLILEDESTTTLENLVNSQKFLNQGQDTVGIITSDFHVFRSVRLAKKAGYLRAQGIAAPCRTVLLPHYMVREAFALGKEILHKNI